jgi:NAD(P)-dependent dehydrogenase (short-subunit alcohol dehydrogenase family)/rhamnose utilization protein RhaD (predicted bifunctional aldolase and dehydrogenase)
MQNLTMDKSLKELISISNNVGSDLMLVQGGGGNTSVKTDDGKYMYIKASGTALKDMSVDKGWRKLDFEKTLSILNDQWLASLENEGKEAEITHRLNAYCVDGLKNGARPSVESMLHAMLGKYVIHLHPVVIGAYVSAKNGRKFIEKLFANEKKPVMWINYDNPGLTLAQKVSKLISDYVGQHNCKPEILILEKHGLFVSADNLNSSLKLVSRVVKICSANLKAAKAVKVKAVENEIINDVKLSIRKAFYNAANQYVMVSHFLDEQICAFMNQKDARKHLSFPALTPDEMVYANGPAVWLENAQTDKVEAKIKKYIENKQKIPFAFLVKGAGLFVVGKQSSINTVRDIVKGSFFIRQHASSMGGINALNNSQREFINNWEAESFRKAVADGVRGGELLNRIAIVTGAGSGLGRGLAIGLAGAGANVALADIDEKAALETAEIIKSKFRGCSTMILPCNVTSEESVNNGFNKLIEQWGGLDILVNAAGVAPAFSLTDLPVNKWRFALEVNLTGYFLMAQKAAQIMIAQGMGGNIINLSSKSGIDPSKNNTPYNATKSGEIHMARGWAMELGKHNIRVNSVCPGNVFEGSKIWNPEYIKVCAKKYGIKPEEVIPYYVSKTMLGREIKGQNIADAVVFLVSDKAKMITAQTLVVDAGQAMVR